MVFKVKCGLTARSTARLFKAKKHHTFLNETKTYYERLKGFAYLFGFKNVQMLRSLDKIKTFNDPEYVSIPVRQRIAMNYIDDFREEEFYAMADLIGE